MRHILIALDRDGTLNEDDNFYLGKSEAWRKQLAILPGVASGIRSLNLIPHSYVAVISNQSGVAIADQEFEGLTEERVHEVNTEIESILRRQGCRIDGFFSVLMLTTHMREKRKKRAERYIRTTFKMVAVI